MTQLQAVKAAVAANLNNNKSLNDATTPVLAANEPNEYEDDNLDTNNSMHRSSSHESHLPMRIQQQLLYSNPATTPINNQASFLKINRSNSNSVCEFNDNEANLNNSNNNNNNSHEYNNQVSTEALNIIEILKLHLNTAVDVHLVIII